MTNKNLYLLMNISNIPDFDLRDAQRMLERNKDTVSVGIYIQMIPYNYMNCLNRNFHLDSTSKMFTYLRTRLPMLPYFISKRSAYMLKQFEFTLPIYKKDLSVNGPKIELTPI